MKCLVSILTLNSVISFVMFSVNELLIPQTVTISSWEYKPGFIGSIWTDLKTIPKLFLYCGVQREQERSCIDPRPFCNEAIVMHIFKTLYFHQNT